MTASLSNSPAITVRFLAPTKTRNARMKAIVSSRVYRVYAYAHELTSGENHALACEQLLLDLGISGDYLGSADAKGVYHFVDLKGE